MNLSLYKTNDLESWIICTYQKNRVYYAPDLDIDRIAGMFNASILYHPGQTKVIWNDRFGLIYINESLDERQRREQAFHEIGHVVRHAGFQNGMHSLFIELQEYQAAHFQLYASIPCYMLEPYCHIQNQQEYISTLSNDFRLPIPLVRKRIEQIQNRIYLEQQERDRKEHVKNQKPITQEYIRKKREELGRQWVERFGGQHAEDLGTIQRTPRT
ncbi:ImmA/IrrE family metallo-endopeptidase [Paenibacillus periandrae]|uniref:ImmA/IrrE family metallo-endopeptidase n=1 Tax=Paenibacillus periandrae TaxID=1761741 RepID=UPI001F094218|nr:ImmA/IrrE family metallo-endopeptidase [Paenibacillus periandrae]